MKTTLLYIRAALFGLVLTIGILSCRPVHAQTDTSNTVEDDITRLYGALTTPSNTISEAHILYAKNLQKKIGGGVGYFWLVNQYVYTGVRLDYVNGGFWMPSGSATLQLPMHPLSKFTFLPGWLSGVQVTPLGYVGMGIPVSGATVGSVTIPGSTPKDNDGQPTAILGYGVAVQVYAPTNGLWDVAIVADRETWSGFAGQQDRFGGAFHAKF